MPYVKPSLNVAKQIVKSMKAFELRKATNREIKVILEGEGNNGRRGCLH